MNVDDESAVSSSQELARRNESLARENRVLREKLNQVEEVRSTKYLSLHLIIKFIFNISNNQTVKETRAKRSESNQGDI